MTRFIDIRNQGTGSRFAFFDTGTDTFVSLDCDQAWNSFAGFCESAKGLDVNIQRYHSLYPLWAFDDNVDDIEAFYLE